MSIESIQIQMGQDREIVLETGKLALQASGSLTVRQGDTIVLVTVCSSDPRPGIDYFPLQVDYREKFSAAGRFPGGYFKREGRPSEKEILTSRMTDRPLRPLFPKGLFDEVQVMISLLSADGQNESDVLAMLGASAAVALSDIPFNGPTGALRVGRVNGEFVANPTHAEMADSDLDLVYAGLPGKTIMIEGAADEISEEVLRDALVFADRYVTAQVEAVRDLVARAGKPKRSPKLFVVSDEVRNAVAEAAGERLQAACMIHAKQERYDALDALCAEVSAELAGRFTDADGKEPNFKAAFDEVTEASVRRLILDQGMRSDGRRADEIRPLSCEAGVLPCVHGSALFSRGETQALVTITLGPEKDSQSFDAITGGESSKSFFLHYNFPNFSVGETGRIMGPGRREIGHGALAERAVAGMIPEDFQYAVRCVSDILGSNGSSSMASVCGASLALMDAGVPLKKPVAGISVGLVTEESGDRKVLLTDILGSEDHYGDMDFKLTGTSDGITAFQLDLKIAGLDIDSMYEAMKANRLAREQILSAMGSCLSAPRSELNPNAPRVHALHINPEKIGALIGPGGKVIRGITERTGANIDVQSDGTVLVFVSNAKTLEAAVHEIESVTAEAEIGKIYRGEVKTVREFGAFVEFLPGQDGLLHVSEMADYRVNNVEEICKVGDFVTVKVIDIDDRGRVRLSRKEALADLD